MVSFSRGFPRVALENSAGLLRCYVTSRGKLYSRLFNAGSSMLRLWHGFGLLQMVGFKVRVPRTGLQVSLARVGGRSCEFRSTRELQEMFKPCSRESRERERAHSRVVLNCPFLDLAHRRLVQSERRYGTEPRLHGCSCKAFSCDENNIF